MVHLLQDPLPWGLGPRERASVPEHCQRERAATRERTPSHCGKVSLLQRHVCGASGEIWGLALTRQNTNGLICHAARLFSYTQW